MKKILVIDILSPKTHIKYARNMQEIILDVFPDADFLSSKGFFRDSRYDLKDKYFKKSKNRFKRIFNEIMKLRSISKVINIVKPTDILVLSFDTVSLSLYKKLSKNAKIAIVFHKNADEALQKKIFIRKLISKQYTFLLLEDYIRDFIKANFENAKVQVLPHPLYHLKSCEAKKSFIFAPSGSNDSAFLNFISQQENIVNLLIEKKYKIIAKSSHNYKTQEFEFYNGFIDLNKYTNLMSCSKIIFVPLKSDFIYRVSGVVLEGISNGNVILANETPYTNSLKNNFKVFTYSGRDFFDKLKHVISYVEDNDNQVQDFVLKKKSDQKIKEKIYELFK